MAQTLSLTREHLHRLRRDRPLFTRTNLYIRTKPPESALVRFEWNTAQTILEAKAAQQKAETGRIRGIVLKARQEGVTTWVAGRVYHGCVMFSRKRGKVLADKLDRAGEIFEIYERFDDENPLRPRQVVSRRARERAWAIDSRISVETAQDKDSGRGGTNDFVHASEFAGWPYPAETLAGLMETVPADAGEAWIESTAKGVGNEFHAMWEAAVQGESEWMGVFLPWWIDEGYRLPLSQDQEAQLLGDLTEWEHEALEVGITWEERPSEYLPAVLPSGARYIEQNDRWILTPAQLAWRRRKIGEGGELRFQQENPSTSEEAFLVTGSPFFDMAALARHKLHARRPIARGHFIFLPGGGVAWSDGGSRGEVRIWEHPDPDGHYVLGADTAEGKLAAETTSALSGSQGERGGRDFSSADVLKLSELVDGPNGQKVRVPCLRQVAQIHGREGLPPDVFAAQVYAAAVWWSCPGLPDQPELRQPHLTGVERNHSSGQTTIKKLRELYRHTNLFVAQQINRRDDDRAKLEFGWITDGASRPLMLDELEELVRTFGIEIFADETIREMRTFVRGGGKAEEGKADDGRPEAQKGCHDDRVMSLAIAVQMRSWHADGSVPPMPPMETPDTPTGM